MDGSWGLAGDGVERRGGPTPRPRVFDVLSSISLVIVARFAVFFSFRDVSHHPCWIDTRCFEF